MYKGVGKMRTNWEQIQIDQISILGSEGVYYDKPNQKQQIYQE